MLLPENPINSIGNIYKQDDFTEIYFHGDYMRKITHLMKDSDDKWKLLCKITDIQNTEYPSVEDYHTTLKSFEKDLATNLQINPSNFII